MVLNFFQLRNHTALTFQIENLENPSDNYNVAPYDTDARHDMWLAQGNGSKGVNISSVGEGSIVSQFLFMWDENYALRYRVGNDTADRSISVNGNKDFYIEVYDTYFKFVCYNGTFDGSNSEVTVTDWKAFMPTK